MSLSVEMISDHRTIDFAGKELVRYHGLMCEGGPDTSGPIRIGLISEFLPGRAISVNPFDDEILIDIDGGRGIIAGSNPRSCLLAAYRLLREAGCRFLRPGTDGELIPEIDWNMLTVKVDEKPSYRHRGICIEGAISREVFLGILDWIPKNGMNAYFIQFRESFTFFDRWYDHKSNPFVPSEAKSVEEVRRILYEGLKAIELRDLIYHAVGHGWTCEPLGIPGLSWEKVTEVPAGSSRFFAELDGKRELFHGVPLNTNLCYGNPEARDLIVNDIVEYAALHPDVDLIHFWLADGMNNHCECPLCRDTRPADFYVAMLNQLDKALSARGLRHRIVFLIYVDLLWPPEKHRIENPGRFVLMFAPITRTYSEAFAPGGRLPALPPYVRNRLSMPKSADENLAFLKPWQELAGGTRSDSFDFDYHLMWDHYRDPGYEDLARVLHEDLRNLETLGMNGLMSCQVQRVFFPTPLPMAIIAETLWDRNIPLDTIANGVYRASFGTKGDEVRSFLIRVSNLFHPAWLRSEEPLVDPVQRERLGKIKPLVAGFLPVIEENSGIHDPCRRKSWKLLALFCDYAVRLADYCQALAGGEVEDSESRLTELKHWVFANEPELISVFDGEIMVGVFDGLIRRLRK